MKKLKLTAPFILMLLLALGGGGAGCVGSAKMPQAHYSVKFIQQQYESGAINYTEYCSMMKDMDANWQPPPPPVGNQYNAIQ